MLFVLFIIVENVHKNMNIISIKEPKFEENLLILEYMFNKKLVNHYDLIIMQFTAQILLN